MSGYVMVDGSGLNFNDLGKVDGLHKQLKTAIGTGKLIIVANTVYGSVSYSPIAVVCADAGDSGIYMDTPTGSYTVSTADVVSENV